MKDWFNFIAGMPDELQLRFHDAPPVRVVHGYPGNPWEAIFPDTSDDRIREMLHDVKESTIIAAHSHIIMDRVVDKWHILNSGSVGVPLDGIRSASYMILDGDATGWRAIQHRVPFDYERLYAEFERQRFVEQVGVTGKLIIEEFKTARLWVHPCQHWCKATYPGEPLTFEHASEFLQTIDPNPYMLPAYRRENYHD